MPRGIYLIKAFLYKYRHWIFLYVLPVGVFAVLFYLHNISWDVIGYGLILSLSLLFIPILCAFWRFCRKHNQLAKLKNADHIFLENLLRPSDVIEQEYWYLVEAVLEEQRKQDNVNQEFRQSTMDYFTLWVHQIKTPIAAMGLLLETSDLGFDKKQNLKMELFTIERYGDMALQYLRMESMTQDLAFSFFPVHEIWSVLLKKYAAIFIGKKISLIYEAEKNKQIILSDPKWLSLALEQILSNALKYTNQGRIKIYTVEEPDVCLVVEDSGSGISSEDLPRIFQRGFTGYNGRHQTQASGLGLFLCEKILKALGHTIIVESKLGQGTKVQIVCKQDRTAIFD